jgi:very-short-patch-repair endonuclease
MKNPGQPVNPPSWYRPRSASPIEKYFSDELGELANTIEQEHWFGDKEKHSRYRVDFLLKDARLIIELDGHEYHSSKAQLEKDAIRQRYLTRSGYSVIRFTGREIYRDAKACMEEVCTIYRERMQREPAKYRIMYIDYTFLKYEMLSAHRFFSELYPARNFIIPNLEDVILSGIEWLHERSFITVQVFHSDQDANEIKNIDGITREFEKGEVRITCQSDPLYVFSLCEHLEAYTHLYDDFLIMADDRAYIPPLIKIFSNCNGKLLRRGNHESSFIGTDLVRVNWQNIYYPIGHAYGLELTEM